MKPSPTPSPTAKQTARGGHGAPPPQAGYSLPCTLHPTPYTLHPTPFTPQPSPFTLHPTPFTLHPSPCILHPTPCTLVLMEIVMARPSTRGEDSASFKCWIVIFLQVTDALSRSNEKALSNRLFAPKNGRSEHTGCMIRTFLASSDWCKSTGPKIVVPVDFAGLVAALQGYLAYKQQPPPRTLQWEYA